MLQARLADVLQKLREDLLSGSYQPLPARRIYIPKANGKQRPLGIPTLRDRIVQRAMLMAMEPIWEGEFHTLSYGFRPERSVHHAIRTVKLQLTDNAETRGRWVIEGDLSSYFDTVHQRLLMKAVRRRIRDTRFLELLWKTIKAGHIDVGLFRAASEGVPQGGVITPRTILHTFFSGAGASRRLAGVEAGIRINPEHHQNLVFVNLDAFDQTADDLALGDEIDSAQSVMDSRGKLFETINHEKQLALPHLMTP
ncbi:reverse transcriptase domain-containing protein [Pseudomonas gorinensis]